MQKTSESIAIIISYYNGSRYIERALKSIYAQTVTPQQIIIVNDGSLFKERDFLVTLQSKFQFTILDKQNGGQSSARNLGVKTAQTEYICFLDQDDFYLPNHLYDLFNALPKNKECFGYVYGDVCGADENGNILFRGITYKFGPHPKTNIKEYLEKDIHILPSSILISRKAFLSVNGFDEELRGYEDDDLFLRLFRAGYVSIFINKPVTVWCLNAQSTTYSIHMARSRFKYFHKLYAIFPDDIKRGDYYFVDYISHRFEPVFIYDSLNASLINNSYKKELNQMLLQYCNLVQKNSFISKKRKFRLRLATCLLTEFPTNIIRIIHYFAYLPIIRRFIRPLLGIGNGSNETKPMRIAKAENLLKSPINN